MTKPCRSTNDSSLLGGAWSLRFGDSSFSTAPRAADGWRLGRELALGAAWALPLTLLAAVGVLVWRRLAGALVQPPPGAMLVAAAAGAALLAAAARCGSLVPGAKRWRRIGLWLPLPALLLFGWAISLPETSTIVLAGVWAILLVEEATTIAGTAWLVRRRGEGAGAAQTAEAVPVAEADAESGDQAAEEARGPGTDEAGEEVESGLACAQNGSNPLSASLSAQDSSDPVSAARAQPEVVQQLTRSQAADGGDRLSGWLRLTFAPGQRNAAAHVAFCPPFAHLPKVEVVPLEGPPGRIKTAQVLPYGVRLEVKLAATPEAAVDLVVRFSAGCAGA